MNRILSFLKRHWVLLLILAIAAVAHGLNMFHFPYYENDEGTYMSQAWSLLTQAKLAPYTYWYDHAPAGWILIAIWTKLTGGFFTFGVSVNTGRVLMLVLHVLSTYFLYSTLEKASGRKAPAVIASLIFSLSPLGVYYQRRVLLDNIMVFWTLLAFWLVVREKLKLRHVVASALAFGVAVLSKENAVFFGPAFVYVIWVNSRAHIRRFTVINWLVISGSIVSLYFLYALLNGELFPTGLAGNAANHVSLLTTLKEQASRGLNVPFWKPESEFRTVFAEWLKRDPFILWAGIAATITTGILSFKNKYMRGMFLMTLLFWIFLIRGKLVIDFYVVPLIPLLAACIGLSLDWLIQKIPFKPRSQFYAVAVAVVLLAAVFAQEDIGAYNRNETWSQSAIIDWTKQNINPNANIAIDGYAYVDYHDSRFKGDPIFPNAEWFWKISYDPEIRDKKFNDAWDSVNYLALSHEMLKQIGVDTQPMLKTALVNSTLIKDWYAGSIAFRDVSQFKSTNGDWMSVYKLKTKEEITLDNSWAYYKQNFIHSYGQVIDPQTKTTTSEGQSYAMLRAVWMNDKPTFDGVWAWTHDHMQYRTQDKLFSWRWADDGTGKYVQTDTEPATDADIDIATALVLASEKFNDPKYLELARPIIDSIWDREIVESKGQLILLPNTNSLTPDGYLINLSYFSPAAYRLFAQVDQNPAHDYGKLIADTYALLNRVVDDRLLPPNWIVIGQSTGNVKSAVKYAGPDADNFGYDAFRVSWRIGLDMKFFGSSDALFYLGHLAGFYSNEWATKEKFYAIYGANGEPAVNYASLSTDAGGVIAMSVTSQSSTQDVYNKLIQSNFHIESGAWGDGRSYYDQNWAWFATAFQNGTIMNSKYFKP